MKKIRSSYVRNSKHMERYMLHSKRNSQYKSYKKEKLIEINNFDYTILVTVILLVLIGIVMVFSSSYYTAASKSIGMYHYLKMQSLVAFIGFLFMMFISNVNYRYLKNFTNLLYFFSIILLILVFLFGKEVNGAKRWIMIPGTGIGLQPSEIAKISVILIVSKIVSSKKDILNTLSGTIYPLMFVIIIAIFVGISNLSTAIVILLIGGGIIFIASPYTLIFLGLGTTGIIGLVSYLAFFAKGFRGARFSAWLNPFSDPRGKGFQIVQSLYAIGSGGMFGLGLGQSRQKLGFIPEAHNDIIFSIICEELGLIGAGLVLFLFGILLWRTIKVAIYATDLFGSLIATGIGIMIGSQVIINIAVVTNTIPNTGVPLPFISYGGTSLAIMMSAVGILLNISRYSKVK